MNGAQVFAEILKREGVEYLFCFPTTPLIDACAAAGIRPIVTRQERVAGNMADGFSRVTNGERIGVVSVQQSAGAENAFAGLAHAYTDSSPILFVPGQWGREFASLPPNFSSVDNYRGAAKWADQIPSVQGMEMRLRRAFTLLRSGRPRPVILELPVDVAAQVLNDDRGHPVESLGYVPARRVRSQADWADIRAAVDLLTAAGRLLIWAGQGCLYAEASAELTELAELTGARVMSTLLAKSVIDERHPLSVGCGSYTYSALIRSALADCDTVLAVGASLNRNFIAPEITRELPGGKRRRIIHANIEIDDINTYYPADVALVGDAKLVLRQLIEEIHDRGAECDATQVATVTQLIAAQRTAWQQSWRPLLESDAVPINPYRVIADFMSTFDPAETIVSHESGSARDMLVPHYLAATPRSYLGWGHSTQLGFSLGACMGAKLARPEKLVAHFMGDGALGMVVGDLETAVREEIPILTVLMNNSHFGNYERMIPTSARLYDSAALSGDFSAVAAGLGLHSERVDTPEALVPALKRAAQSTRDGRAALVEVITTVEPRIPYAGDHLEDLEPGQ